MQKKLQEGSRFAKYDLNNDGTVDDQELTMEKELLELELREEKSDAQKRMAWIAMASMLLFTMFLFHLLYLIAGWVYWGIYLVYSISHRLVSLAHTWVSRRGWLGNKDA